MSKKQSAGGQRVRWQKGPEQVFQVWFVSFITGDVRGVRQVSGQEIFGSFKPSIRWWFDGKVGSADKVGDHWETKVWDDEEHFRRFPDTADWVIRNFGVREVK
jgi:hypothetical protein